VLALETEILEVRGPDDFEGSLEAARIKHVDAVSCCLGARPQPSRTVTSPDFSRSDTPSAARRNGSHDETEEHLKDKAAQKGRELLRASA
jgi:hypothetical protein